jgi:redox-sensitive bicupin YhaK (pirin superfamily)
MENIITKADRQYRTVTRFIAPETTYDGGGVKIRRSIASHALNHLDPFLLLDHFGSDNPDEFSSGFPMHPHRGIETVTYMLEGSVRHRDSLGNTGVIGSGDVQWMTAGRGIMHEEMPQSGNNRLSGFQLWVNLPARLKMVPPRYRDVKAQNIPTIETKDGATVKIIAGLFQDVRGAVREIYIEPLFLDVTMKSRAEFDCYMPAGHSAFAYVYDGQGEFGLSGSGHGKTAEAPLLVVMSDGDALKVKTATHSVRFLLISGKPLHEPIARYGPFVMNTREEIEETLKEIRSGKFGK